MKELITDSRKIKPGDTFIAIRGLERDGHNYILDAIQNGATKIICEEGHYEVETIIVSDTKKYLETYLHDHYYLAISKLKLVGVTGTNGKTTTCYLAYQMLKKLGHKVAYIGTIGFYMMDEVFTLKNTTPDLIDLYDMFLNCVEHDISIVVMEVSSHALALDRTEGLAFDIVAFTNLTQDHLDFHQTFDQYLITKQKLFNKLRKDKIAIINNDDKYASEFILQANNNLTISTNKGDVIIKDINLTNLKTKFTFDYNHNSYHITIPLVGRYNIYNYLTALFIVHNLGYQINDILKINDELITPPGRMAMIKYKSNSIFVDYAHTPDAVSNVLQNVKEYKTGQVITIIGCGGERDKSKRPLMGQAATSMSDYVIFTNDNPRHEDEKEIIKDIITGLTVSNYDIIYDRQTAIFKGMSLLTHNDILLILGKGHETYQIIEDDTIPFNDSDCVYEYIANQP